MLLKRPPYNAFFYKVPLRNVAVKFDVFLSSFSFSGGSGWGGVGWGYDGEGRTRDGKKGVCVCVEW